MFRRKIAALASLVVLGTAGCNVEPVEMAATGGTPVIDTPVGPIPGPGPEPNLKTNPYASNPVVLRQGRQLFVRYNCAGCHGGHAGGGMGPSLRDPDWIYGSSDAHIFSSIAQGRAHGMPAWGAMLPEDQIWQLVAYINSLGMPQEPQPPKP